MATLQVEQDDDVILVELTPTAGTRAVSISPTDMLEKSKEAMDHAMKSISSMAKKTVKSVNEIPISERPTTISVTFGLKLNAEGNAVVAKAGMDATLNITMTWQHKDKQT
jgi:hypothetical protein